MKSAAEKSSASTSTTSTHTTNQPFFAKAGGGTFFAPVWPGPSRHPNENDRESTRRQIRTGGRQDGGQGDADARSSHPPAVKKSSSVSQRKKFRNNKTRNYRKPPATGEKLQRKGCRRPRSGASAQTAIQNKITGGQPLSSDVRSYMEPRFGADFSNVRIHSDPESASLSNQLSARAFTYQNHVFFSRDQYQPGTSEGKQLLAHELTHTIQQGHAVQRSPQVTTTVTPPPVQRLGVQDALDKFAEWAYNIPGFRLLTIVLGLTPSTCALLTAVLPTSCAR